MFTKAAKYVVDIFLPLCFIFNTMANRYQICLSLYSTGGNDSLPQICCKFPLILTHVV